MRVGFRCSALLPTVVIVGLFHGSHSLPNVGAYHFGFYLHFLDDLSKFHVRATVSLLLTLALNLLLSFAVRLHI
jgi:hypothetical protein